MKPCEKSWRWHREPPDRRSPVKAWVKIRIPYSGFPETVETFVVRICLARAPLRLGQGPYRLR